MSEAGGERGFEGKKVNERKRHIVMDTLGHLIRVRVHAADLGDREVAEALVAAVTRVCLTLTKL